MTYKERQEYFKVKHQQVDEKALMSTQPEREAKMEAKRKNREWSKNSKVIEGIFRKPAKLLQKEKKQVAQLLDEKFSPNEPTGQTPDKSVSQISHLKYIPPLRPAFTAKERNVRRTAGLINKGYKMYVLAYYQGLTFDKKGKSYMVNKLNHMWVRDIFAEPFFTLVKNIGKEETQSDVLVIHRKWIPVPVG
jgi:transposase